MYRPPIRSGHDAIGAAIGAGLAGAAGSVAEGLAERRRRDLEAAELARRDRLEREARERAERDRALEMARMGETIVAPEDAYNTIDGAALGGAMRGVASAVPAGLVPGLQDARGALQGAAATAEATTAPTRVRRADVQKVGDEYVRFDPTQSRDFQRAELLAERQRAEVARERNEIAEAIMGLDPNMTRAEADARARGISIADPVTRAQALTQLREDLDLKEVYDIRAGDRDVANRIRVSRATDRGGGGGGRVDPVVARQTRQAQLRGLASGAAEAAIRQADAAGPWPSPERRSAWIRANTRERLRQHLGEDSLEANDLAFEAANSLLGLEPEESDTARMTRESQPPPVVVPASERAAPAVAAGQNAEVSNARAAIRGGAPREAVAARMAERMGISVDRALEMIGS